MITQSVIVNEARGGQPLLPLFYKITLVFDITEYLRARIYIRVSVCVYTFKFKINEIEYLSHVSKTPIARCRDM